MERGKQAMISKKILKFAGFAAAALFSISSAGTACAAGIAEPKAEYSADQFMGSGEKTIKSRVYHAPGKQRMEMEEGGGRQVVITRADRKLLWIVMPDQKMYMERSLEEGKKERRDLSDCSFAQKAAGKETVNGIDAVKSEIEVSCPDKSEYGGTMWTSKEGIMVKMDAVAKGKGSKGRFRMELKNLKIGKQDPKLFEVPSGYQLMKMPMGIVPGSRPVTGKQEDPGRDESDSASEKDLQERSRPKEPPKEKGTVEKAVEPMKKIKNLFGW
jgi:outer membrane lipoprotein-sorting protein